MSGGVVCYIERQPGGTGIKRLRLIAAGLARTWTAPEPRSVSSVDSGLGGGTGPTVGAAKAGAMWIAETLAAVGLKRLAAVCVDSEGSICAWLSAPSPESSVIRATIIQSGVDGDGSGAGVGAARLLTMADGDAALTGQTSLQALATLEPEEAEVAAPAAKGKGLTLRRKAPVIAARKQRYAVVAIQDAVVRVLLDELDTRGIEVERTLSLWHAMAGAWDRNDSSFSDRLSASSPSGAVILVEPQGRLVWAWTRAGELIAGGSMRLSTPPRRTPTPATPAAPGPPAAEEGATDALATQTAAAESARRTVFESSEPDEGSSNIEFTAADAGRLAVDWLAWSAQLGHCPQRVVCLSVPAVSGGGLGPEALFSHLSKAWPGATIDGAVHEDPIGATVGRLAGLGPEVSVMPGERIARAADEMPYHYRPREALIGLTARPGVADRRLHQWIGISLFAAAGFVGVMGWQIRSSIGTAEAEIKIAKKEREAALDSASAVVPGGKANNKAEDALRAAVTRVQDQLRALKPARPVLEETVRLLGALKSINEDPATSGGAARTLMNELEMNSFAGKLSLQVPDAATGPTILEKVLETEGVLVWNGSTGYTPAGQPGRNYVLLASWPETNVVTPGRKPAAASRGPRCPDATRRQPQPNNTSRGEVMIDQPQASGAADEAKLELSMAATASERANKPRWIVVLGSLVLAATVIFTLVSWQSRASVVAKVRTEQDKTRKILELKNQLDGETNRLNARGTVPDPRMGQHIERLATTQGIALTPPQVLDTTANVMSQIGMQQHKYNAKAINQEPRAVLEWLRQVLTSADTAGLEITRLVIRPGAATASGQPGWNIDVDFNRWEKIKP